MNIIYSYKSYQVLQAINEAIDEIIDTVADQDVADQLTKFALVQDEIFDKYPDMAADDISKIRNSIEDTIKLKLGQNENKK